ncbi:heme-binding protein [uncultured Cocleimonas sp.]|uniref:heme-binding protein n=1 Tax=uncultured Cocleimonas sp. TaxID=1051587 RepID=UPI00261B4C0F|nr:heme-binding protein [uncultured Cocleimonas sp.]
MIEYEKNSAGSDREIRIATTGDESLGPLQLLPGKWANIRPEHRIDDSLFKGDGTLTGAGESPFDGRGWNLIALPFKETDQRRNYRILMNQYNEVLSFNTIDDKIPNRGLTLTTPAEQADQRIAALDYEQMIAQISAKDIENSEVAGNPELPIHHEPGFFLHMRDQTTEGIDIGRLATIPHGNAVTALGKSEVLDGPPTIPDLSGFPEGVNNNIVTAVDNATNANSYLFPYNQFTLNPFQGVLSGTPFPGFSPANANALLQLGLPANVVKTTVLELNTNVFEAGIVNIPFVVRQADAAEMRSTFWIMELDETDQAGRPKLVMAYSQFIFLDFFNRFDGRPGLIRWPHISINMLEKIEWPEDNYPAEAERMIMKSH